MLRLEASLEARRILRLESSLEARRILRLVWPIMLTSLNWTLMHLIDVVVVGLYGTQSWRRWRPAVR